MTIEDDFMKELDHITEELKRLEKMKITIGIQGVAGKNKKGETVKAEADIMTIAGVHEFGATIKAKNVKNLAIPISKKAVGKSPLDFDNLFFIRSEEGLLFGCISNKDRETNPRTPSRPSNKKPEKKKPKNEIQLPQNDDDIEYLFILFQSVEIPERSFIRAGYDSSKEKIASDIDTALNNVMHKGWDAEKAANYVGMKARDYIVEYMMNASNFRKKSNITKSTSNWPDNPLVETARLRNSITYAIMEES